MTAITIVRHGNTFGLDEPPRRIGSRTDLPLTLEGRAQATALGRWFAAQRRVFATALCGPLQRTMETARLILDEQPSPVPLRADGMLTEIDHGIDEDQSEAAVRRRIGADALRRWDEEGIAPEGWIVDRSGRIAWWRDLFRRSRGDPTLVVTSNGAARFALLALAEAARPADLKLRTGAFGQIEGDGIVSDPYRCVAWNQRPAPGGRGA